MTLEETIITLALVVATALVAFMCGRTWEETRVLRAKEKDHG